MRRLVGALKHPGMSDWPKYDMDFLDGRRQRRLRRTGWMRDLVRETTLTPADFIWPLFVIDGHNERTQIKTMPGVERLSVDLAVQAARDAAAAGIPALALFPNTPDHLRNADGSEAYNPDNLMCRALRAIKDAVPDIGILTDIDTLADLSAAEALLEARGLSPSR